MHQNDTKNAHSLCSKKETDLASAVTLIPHRKRCNNNTELWIFAENRVNHVRHLPANSMKQKRFHIIELSISPLDTDI